MKLVLKLKLSTNDRAGNLLRETTRQYWQACNLLSKRAFDYKIFSKFELQPLVYQDIKTEFKLPAQLVIRGIAEVCSSYKALLSQISEHNRTCKPEDRRTLDKIEFSPNLAVPYDERVLRFDTDKCRISLRTLSKRVWINFQAGESRKHLLPFIQGQADLKRCGKKWYLLQTIEVPEDDPICPTNHLGVDLGICTVASATDGVKTLRFSGSKIRSVRNHHYELRRGLQRHNTYSSRRRVRTLRDKESRRVRNYNHLVSRRILEQAKRTNSTIVLEDLEGIREGVKVTKSQRRERFSWAYAQLIGFIVYKAKLSGVSVMFVPPAYTSKTCSECFYMSDSNRQTQAWFKCRKCGFFWNADDNASINIRFLGAESTRHKRQTCMQEYLWTDRRKPVALAIR